jgi:hypothetical protein
MYGEGEGIRYAIVIDVHRVCDIEEGGIMDAVLV